MHPFSNSRHKSAEKQFDAVVIGSGFGGGTVALRLTQAGKRVLILERGRRWRGQNMPADAAPSGATPFPALGDKHFFWGRQIWHPSRQRLGLFDLRQFINLQGLTAAGVGGGSLIWANVVIEAPKWVFEDKRWPREITRESLQKYYDRAQPYLRPAFVPGTPTIADKAKGRTVPRAALLKAAAERLNENWSPVRIAVKFGDESAAQANGHGQARQKGCNYCGLCSAGCPQNAKNTVDTSYIAEAEALGATLQTLTAVRFIQALPGNQGYRVHYERFDEDGKTVETGTIDAPRVIVSAGTFGSTDLLLRSRAKGLLNNLSCALGSNFSVNGNVLSGALRKNATPDEMAALDSNSGPAIASMIDYGDHVVEDFANPTWANGIVGGTNFRRITSFIKALLGFKASEAELKRKAQDLLVYVGVGTDRARGRLSLNSLGQLTLKWPGGINNDPVVKALHRSLSDLAKAQGRQYVPNVFSIFNRPLTYHPLGGCPMSVDSTTGVVDQYGRVFGHPGLYIADGSIVPTALGRNPSFTIAALSERVAEALIDELEIEEES